MPFTYRQVKDLYDVLKDSGAVTKSLPDWSQEMNSMTESDLYGAGANDNFVKQMSVGIDRGIEAVPGLVSGSRELGRGFGELFGHEEAGASIGEGLPRMTANFLPIVAGSLATGGIAPAAAALGLAGTGLMSGAQTYTETGSPAAGLLSGVTAAALPGVTNKLEQGILRGIGGRAVTTAGGEIAAMFPKNFGQSLVANLGGQVGASALTEASGFGQDYLSGQPLHDPFTAENAIGQTLGQLPFAALHLGAKALKLGKSPMEQADLLQASIRKQESENLKKQMEEAVAQKTPIEQIPEIPEAQRLAKAKETQDAIDQHLELLGIRRQEIEANPTEENVAELGKIAQEEAATIQDAIEQTGGVGIGKANARGAKVDVMGTDHFYKDSTGYHVITISQVPEGLTYNDGTPVQPGDRVGFPGGNYDPKVNLEDSPNFQLPKGKFTKVVDRPSQKAVGQQTPELPIQAAALDLEQHHLNMLELEKVKNIVKASSTWGEAVSALEQINHFRKELGRPEIDLASLKAEAERRGLPTADRAIHALADETSRMEMASAEAKADSMKRMKEESDIQNELYADAQMGDPMAQEIINLYTKQSEESGRRGRVAVDNNGESPFWRHAFELQKTGKLTLAAMRNWKEGAVIASGKGLKSAETEKVSKADLEPKLFQALSSDEAAAIQIGAEMVMKVMANDARSDEARTLRQILATGIQDKKFDFNKESVAAAAEEAGVAEAGPDANLFAEDFLKSEKVKGWLRQLGQQVIENEMPRIARAPSEEPSQLPAGGGFVWGMANYDPASNKLGGKHTLPKSGEIPVTMLKAIGGRGKPLQDVEIDMMRAVNEATGSGAFEGDKVNVGKLWAMLKENPVQVEVKKLGEGQASAGAQRQSELIHELDTLQPRWRIAREGELSSEAKKLKDELDTLREQGFDTGSVDQSKYKFLGPKAESEMPGYVEGLVRIPTQGKNPMKESVGIGEKLHNPKYIGPHFGAEDTNVLAFFRGFEETSPSGEKTFHVIEVQSDWGQARRKAEDRFDGGEPIGGYEEEMDRNAPKHPLLPVYETLALKAAVNHAREIGATRIFLPDAETAMMTEGHDKAARPVATETGFVREEPPQSGGMRLHYDTTLPSAMRKLTGDKGERMEVGVHKAASANPDPYLRQNEINTLDEAWERGDFDSQVDGEKEYRDRRQALVSEGDQPPPGSPVFKNPDGTPKSQISGTSYDLSKINSTAESQGGLTLGDPSRAPGEPLYVPEGAPALETVAAISGDGVKLVKEILKSPDLGHQAIARELLANYPEALSLIQSEVREVNGAAFYNNEGRLGGRIVFGPGAISANPIARNQTALHEVIHGLTMHLLGGLPEGHPLIVQLDGLRLRAVEALPKGMKESYNKAVASNWLERYKAEGTSEVFAELAPDAKSRAIVYSLLNHEEMTAQAFSSKPFKEYLQGIDGKTGVWKKFVAWTKQLLGLGERVDNTAFGELLETTNQLMQEGEYLASFQNFGERYFEGKGKGGAYGKAQTIRAMGLLTNSEKGISSEELVRSLGAETGANPALASARRRLEQQFSEKGEDFQVATSILDELGHDPSVRGLDDLIETGIADSRGLQDEMDLMPEAAAKYVFEKLKDHRDVLDMIRAATKAKNEGLLNIAEPGLVRGPVAKAIKQIEKVLANEKRQADFAQDLVNLDGVSPDGYAERMARAPQIWEDFVEGTKGLGASVVKGLTNFLEPTGQMARRIPEAAEILSKGYQLTANGRNSFSNRVKVFGVDTSSPHINPSPTHESVKQSEKVFSTPKLLTAADKWVYWNNKEGGNAVKMLPDSHPEIAKVLNGLTSEEKAMVHDIVSKQGMSTQAGHADNLEYMTQIAAVNGAGVAMTELGGKTKDNLALSDTLLRAVLKTKDPMTMWQAQAEIQSVQARMAPEAFLNLLQFTKGEAEKIGLWKEYYDANPFWATAQRTERFLIKGFKGKEPKNLQASSVKEARSLIEKNGLGRNTDIVDQWKGKEDEPFAHPNMTPEMAQRMEAIEDTQIAMLKKSGILPDEAAVEEFKRTSAVTQIMREATTEGSISGVIPPARRLSKGAEDLPWMWNHISHAQRESTYWSRALLRAQTRTYLREPELAADPELRQRLATHFENLLQPDPIAAQKMTKFASVWFMGFNLASSIINSTQPFMTHVAELTAITGKTLDSYKRTMAALKEAGGAQLGRKEWATPEHGRLMEDAARDGERSLSMFDDDAQAQESIATNYKRAMMKNKTQSLGQRLSTGAGAYSTAAMWVFRHGEQLNATAALLSAFDVYREQGLTYDQAKAKAYEFNHAVNFSGGRAQRSVGAYSGRGAFPRTVAMLGTSLQSYVLGTTFQIGRYLYSGLFRPKGLTPHEVYAARKAAFQMLGTQFAAAGLLGLPFASGAIALLDKMFPDLELNRKIREGMAELLGSDSENGNILTDVAMTGVPSMLGWDMQSRLSMGNSLPGVSEVNGFQAENLLGPSVNIVKNFVSGVQGWSKGDAGATKNFLPRGARNLIDAGTKFLSGEDEIRDFQGRPLANSTRGEKLGLTLGFQPKRLSDQNAASRILSNSSEVSQRRESAERTEQAQEILKGNFGSVRQQLVARAQSDNSYNPQDAIRGIARTVEELSFPRDLRREGNRNTNNLRSSFLNSFSNLSSSPSEEERFVFRQQVEARLGLPPTRASSELQLARLMDQLKISQPGVSRLELRATAQQLLRRTSSNRGILTSPEE